MMSGFTSADLARRGLVLPHGRLLTKLFEPAELLSLIGQLLQPSFSSSQAGTPPGPVIPSTVLTPQK
jgi:hypothetical protein